MRDGKLTSGRSSIFNFVSPTYPNRTSKKNTTNVVTFLLRKNSITNKISF
ncbi:hypothetical protein LEP1GSC137_2107 [Leptospira borgpetersenii str. Noumea 25]|nr:hypothetical protein LEP1GSC137_2107 [Leptospira borgpetersenii str. Noumea 25]